MDGLTDQHAAAVVAAMKDVARETTFILLSLSGFRKKRAKTPPDEIVLAESRLADWRRRGRARGP